MVPAAVENTVGYFPVMFIPVACVGLTRQVLLLYVQLDNSSWLLFILIFCSALPLKHIPGSCSTHQALPPLEGMAGLIESFLLKLSSSLYPLGTRVPFNVKSSKRKVPVADAPDNDITIVIVPARLLTGFKTVVVPMAAPVVGTVPEPTEIPLMVIDQFCAPVALRWRQKSKLVMFIL